MRIMGKDLSITATGIALPSGQLATIRTRPKDGDRRLCHIREALTWYVDTTRPDFVVIEDLTAYKGHKTLITLAMVHSHAREILAARGIPFGYVHSSMLKKYATGDGGAGKPEMIAAAVAQGVNPANDNEADAWWLHWVGHHWNQLRNGNGGQPNDELVERMTKDWPEPTGAAPHSKPGQPGR